MGGGGARERAKGEVGAALCVSPKRAAGLPPTGAIAQPDSTRPRRVATAMRQAGGGTPKQKALQSYFA